MQRRALLKPVSHCIVLYCIAVLADTVQKAWPPNCVLLRHSTIFPQLPLTQSRTLGFTLARLPNFNLRHTSTHYGTLQYEYFHRIVRSVEILSTQSSAHNLGLHLQVAAPLWQVEELRALAEDDSDPAMAELAAAERSALVEQLAARERALLLQLLPKDDVDDRGIVLEVPHELCGVMALPASRQRLF